LDFKFGCPSDENRKELERELIDSRLTRLLKSFKTDELDLGTITEEAEIVRQEIHDKKKH